MNSLYLLAWRNLQQGRVRALLSMLSVALGATMVVAANTMGNGLRASFDTGGDRPDGTAWVVDFTETSLQGVGTIILIAAAFLIFNAFMMSVTQRQKEIGMLRALGMTRRQVLRLVLLEGVILGGGGSLLGLLLGPLLGNGLLSFMGRVGFAVSESGQPSPGAMLLAVALSLGMTLLSVLVPARRATQMSPLAALRASSESGSGASGRSRRWLVRLGAPAAGVALLLVTAGYASLSPPGSWADPPRNLQWGLLLSLGWLSGTLLLLPRLVGGLVRVGKRPLTRAGGVIGSMVSDNLNRSRQRVFFTLLTFVVGLTMIVSVTGVTTFMSKVLFDLLLERTTAQAGWGLWPFDQTQGAMAVDQINGEGFAPELVADVRDTIGDRAVVARNWMVVAPEVSAFFAGFPSTIVDLEAFGRGIEYNFVAGDLDTALAIMEAGCGLLIPPDVAGRHDAVVGDVIRLQAVSYPIDCTVAGIGVTGIYPSTLISPAAAEAFAVADPITLVVVPQPGVDTNALEKDLLALDRKYGDDLWLIKSDESSEALQAGGDMLIGLLNVMLLLAVLAAGLGVVNTTMMSVTQRQQELGLLRALGTTRRQVQRMIMGEAAFIGLIGGLVGLVVGAGVSMLFALSFGGRSYGIPDIPLWRSAWQATQPALVIGLTGLVLAPLISAAAAILPARAILRGTPVAVLYGRAQADAGAPARAPFWQWGTVRVRFVGATAVLLFLTLFGLISFVVRHARGYMDEQARSAATSMVQFNASLIELNLPPDAERLTLDALPTQQFDAAALLRMRALLDELGENGFRDFAVTDQAGVVLFSFDPRETGRVRPALPIPDRLAVRIGAGDEGRDMLITAPVTNERGTLLGHVQMTMGLAWIDGFVAELRQALWLAGGLIALAGIGIAYLLTTPLSRRTRQLAQQAGLVAQGIYAPLPQPQPSWLIRRTSLRTRLTAVLALILLLLVIVLELITLPIERRRMEETVQEAMIAGTEWLAQGVGDLRLTIDDFGLNAETMIGDPFAAFSNPYSVIKLQELAEQMQNENVAYTAVADADGVIQLADPLRLVGAETAVVSETILTENEWRGEDVWQIATPLLEEGEQSGVLLVGVRRSGIELFLAESRNLFRLTGVIALLAGVLLAQIIGSAVTAPVRRLAAGARRVGAGDLTVQFAVQSRDELAQLAHAFNEMVHGLQEREWLRDMFGRFVSREVAAAIRSGQVQLAGENRVVSVLFCDIRGFTTRSERSTPQEIVALLNEYLPVVVDAAQQHQGTVNKFGGDSTLVIYGAPQPVQASAYQAVLTALEMRHSLALLNEKLVARSEEPIRIGIGINTGSALAGAVGPPQRQEYTVIGDTVNLASRIEALNKEYPQHDILISDHTYNALGSHRADFRCTDLGLLPIRGKANPVHVWAVEDILNGIR